MKRKLHYVISSQSVTFGKSEIKQNLWMKIFNNSCSLWNITYRSYYSHWISQPTKLCIFLFTDFHWFTWFWSLPTLKPRVTDFEEEPSAHLRPCFDVLFWCSFIRSCISISLHFSAYRLFSTCSSKIYTSRSSILFHCCFISSFIMFLLVLIVLCIVWSFIWLGSLKVELKRIFL